MNTLKTTLLLISSIFLFLSCEKDIQGISQYDLMVEEPWLIQSINGDTPQECAVDDTYSFIDEGPLVIHFSGTPCYGNPDESQEGRYVYTAEERLIIEYQLGPFDVSDTFSISSISNTKMILKNPNLEYILVHN